MTTHLRIAVADDEARMREFYQAALPVHGHTVVCAAATGAELIEGCRSGHPNLIITDIKMPDVDGLDALEQINRHDLIPAILVTAHDEPELLERAGHLHVVAYLVKPIKRQDLQPAIVIAMTRFAEFVSLRQETSDLRQALQDRKLIERAKGILMKRTKLDEPAAFKALQKMARDKNRKLVHIAEMIVTAEEAFGQRKS